MPHGYCICTLSQVVWLSGYCTPLWVLQVCLVGIAHAHWYFKCMWQVLRTVMGTTHPHGYFIHLIQGGYDKIKPVLLKHALQCQKVGQIISETLLFDTPAVSAMARKVTCVRVGVPGFRWGRV